MQSPIASDRRGVLVVGLLLVAAGIAAFGARAAGFDPFEAIGDNGWPLFVIAPGLVLLLASVVPPVPKGVGFAIAGSIVTVIGLVLFYQQSSDHWESWAYAWALVGPGAAGLGMLAYGLLFRQGDLVRVGLSLCAIAAVLFTAGFWFFESIFDSGRAPADLDTWWPVGLIGIGLIVLIGGMVGSTRRHPEP